MVRGSVGIGIRGLALRLKTSVLEDSELFSLMREIPDRYNDQIGFACRHSNL